MVVYTIIGLEVVNPFFQYKKAHKYTREIKSRQVKYIIDLLQTKSVDWYLINDIRVSRSYELGFDRCLVELKLKEQEGVNMKLRNTRKCWNKRMWSSKHMQDRINTLPGGTKKLRQQCKRRNPGRNT